MKNIYIKAAEAISPQNTFEENDFLKEIQIPEGNYFSCITPDYKKYIDPKPLRRMSKIVRMGLATSIKTIQESSVGQPDAIIVGTGLGCLKDTNKFLKQLIEDNESLLNPTPFIQSTHNTVSGQIALIQGCKNYNFTFTQEEVSYETALIDALLSIKEEGMNNVLVGAVDEVIDETADLLKKAGCAKDFCNNIIESNTKGFVPGEGATFFMLSSEKENSSVELVEVSAFNKEIPSSISELINNGEIDVLITGLNGNTDTDNAYKEIQTACAKSSQLAYKQLVGEYHTATAFGMWLGTQVINKQTLPSSALLNEINKSSINQVLIHNYSSTYKHSFIVLKKC